MDILRKWLRAFVRTPLHPQWLLGPRVVPDGLTGVSGALLDIGAGDRWIEPLLPAGVDYVALDYPATGHDLYGAKPDVFADAAHLPFPDGSFNAVTCLEVLEHVPFPAIVAIEIARVLAPGGRAWISMPFLYPLHDAPFDFQRYTEFGLRRDMDRAGLEVVSFRRSCHAIRTAGLLMCLAVAGGLHARQGWRKWLLMPLGFMAIISINMGSWVTSLFWPDWSHLAKGHDLEVRKPLKVPE